MTRQARRATGFMVALAAVLVLTVPSVQLLGGTMNASAYSDISMELDYPRYAGMSETFVCTLTVAGGPAGDKGGNFSYRAQVVGDDTAGASVTPETQTSADRVFKFNVTMPSVAPQTVRLNINVTSTAADGTGSTYKLRDFEVKVVEPIVISATVYNIGDADVKDATVRFYADGALLATKTFSVAKGASTTLRHNWTFVKIDEGEHVVTIVIDESEGLVEFRDGNNVYTLTIYVGERSNPIGAVLTIGVVIMSVLVALTVLQKPSRRKSP